MTTTTTTIEAIRSESPGLLPLVEESPASAELRVDVIASGTTYPLRDQLAQVGATYDAGSKTWRLTPAQQDRLAEIVGRIASATGNAKARAYEAAWDGIIYKAVR